MKTNPTHLLIEMVLHPSTTFSQHEADQFLGSYRSFFQDTSLIVNAPSRKWANCLSCGKTHEITPINGLLILSCPESGVEDVIITADELKSVRFNPSGFYSWLKSQFALQGNIELSDNKVLLGQGMVDNNQRLFIFSQDNTPQARERICQDHLTSQPVIFYFSTTLNNHNQGYDINLTEYLVVQANGLSIDVSSALSVIADTIPSLAGGLPTTSSSYAIELKLQDNMVVVTGTALGGSTPAFKSKRSSTMSKLIKTLLDLSKDRNSKETTFQTYTKNVIEGNQVDLTSFNLNQNKRSLTSLCLSLLPYFLNYRPHRDGDIFEFKSAISQDDWNKLSEQEKQKILASKAI